MVDGRTAVTGLIGDPVAHTRSPQIHNFIAERLGDDLIYVPFHVFPEGLEAAVRGAFELGITGMNVTVPHKQDVIKFLDSIDPVAEKIGAVNTLVRTEKGYRGYNTDYEGFKKELKSYSVDVSGRDVIILGAGGVSRAVYYGLMQMGAADIFIFNRSVDKAEKNFGSEKNVHIMRYDQYGELPTGKYVCVQCTSVGLSPDTGKCVVEDGPFYDLIDTGIDMIFSPKETVFMKNVRKHGGKAYNGLRMLMYQAVSAYELFLHKNVPEDFLEELYEELDT